MAWYYEIVGKHGEVLEASEPIYRTELEALSAANERAKAEPATLIGTPPTTGGKIEGNIRSILFSGNRIHTKYLA